MKRREQEPSQGLSEEKKDELFLDNLRDQFSPKPKPPEKAKTYKEKLQETRARGFSHPDIDAAEHPVSLQDIPPEPEKKPEQNVQSETMPKTLEEKEAVKEIKNLPEEDKEKLGWGLKTIGFRVEKMKNDWFASSLNWGMEKGKLDQKETTGRFIAELRDSFKRDSEDAKNKGLDIQKGKDKGKISKIRNVGLLAGNVLKYGRIVADVTGASIANPFRYAMMGGMVTTRVAEAGKEARLKNEEVIEKTRIQNADKAAEEAWKIYEKARIKNATIGIYGHVSTADLKKSYLMQTPEDLQKRLENPTVALSLVQKALKWNINVRISRLNKKVEEIENSDKNEAEKKLETEKLLNSWKKELGDYDRMLTQYGTVDQIAMGAKYAQLAGKGVVLGMQIETAVVSVEKLAGVISHIDFHDMHPIETTERFAKHIFARKIETKLNTENDLYMKEMGAHIIEKNTPGVPNDVIGFESKPNFHGTSITFEHGHGGIKGIQDLQNQLHKQYPEITKAPQNVQDFVHTDATKEAIKLGLYNPNSPDESALIKAGSVLQLDEQGNLSIHEAITGKEDILIHGDTSQVEQYHETMFHSGHHDISNQVPNQAPTTEMIRQRVLENYKDALHQNSEKFIQPTSRIPTAEEIIRARISTHSGTTEKILESQPASGVSNTGTAEHLANISGQGNLDSVAQVYQNNLSHIFVSNHDDWGKIKDLKIKNVLGHANYENNKEYHPIMAYLHRLTKITGTKPKLGSRWNIFSRPETTDEYIKRALQEAAKHKQLDELKM